MFGSCRRPMAPSRPRLEGNSKEGKVPGPYYLLPSGVAVSVGTVRFGQPRRGLQGRVRAAAAGSGFYRGGAARDSVQEQASAHIRAQEL